MRPSSSGEDGAAVHGSRDAEGDWGDVVGDQATCATCGRALDGDPDEDPTGDAGMPICGECERARNMFVLDLIDGDLDGRIG